MGAIEPTIEQRDGAPTRRVVPSAGDPVLVALVGAGISGSRTPRMHEAEGARLGLRYQYRRIDTDALALGPAELAGIVRHARLFGFAGLNVTIPWKQAVIACLDGLAPDAAAIGAVNTVVFAEGRAIGHNTDAWGFAESARHGLAGASFGRVVLMGAGGAGLAVARALLDLGVGRLEIHDTDGARAQALAARLAGNPLPRAGAASNRAALARDAAAARVSVVEDLAGSVVAADGLVNATPMGMAKFPGMAIDPAWLAPHQWVADIVYVPLETALLRAARAAGCRVLPGAGMAVYQAVRAFELFTGIRPDAAAMRATFDAFDQQGPGG